MSDIFQKNSVESDFFDDTESRKTKGSTAEFI